LENLNICVNTTKSLDSVQESQNLQTHLMEFLRKNSKGNSNIFLEIFNEIHKFATDNLLETESFNVRKKQQIKSKSGRRDKDMTSSSEEDAKSEKKCSMKTANDVLKRIIWDEEINKDFVTVGYLDRFLGLKECAFNLFDWGDIVEADLGFFIITSFNFNNQ